MWEQHIVPSPAFYRGEKFLVLYFFPQALLFDLKKEKTNLRRDDIYNALQDRPDLQTPAAPALFE